MEQELLMKKIRLIITQMFLTIMFTANAQVITETFGTGANQFSIEFVQIGNPGNNADSNGRGAVNYTYNIGKYEVSRDLIINANAAAGLNIDMYGFFTSSLKNPAPHVSWYEYGKFVNYLNTSKGYQSAYNFDSQGNFQAWDSGQYIGSNQFRHKDTKYFLPTLNEWHKAGYYDPQKNGGNGGYWKYATGSDSLPDQNLDGDNNWGPNEVVWGRETFPGPSEVDNAGTLSPYGTMAQNGNTSEWTEDVLDIAGEVRYKIGGHYGWKHDGFNEPTIELDKAWAKSRFIGARIAMVPEPSAFSLLAVGLGGLALVRRRRS
jgi:formylglycine-generating enzyme required for sulfatase activity